MNVPDADIQYADLPHILVVDDDERIRDLVSRYLNQNGFVALMAEDAHMAEAMLRVSKVDALVVDVMMPHKTGIEFVRDLREHSTLPVLLLTALGEIDEKEAGFEVGADDYLPKPFEPRELVMRLNSIFRRAPQKTSVKDAYSIGRLKFDPDLNRLSDGDAHTKLTDVEGRLLSAFLKRRGEILSRRALAMMCEVDDGAERTIDVQVTRLRRKIEEDSRNPHYLITVRGKGYVLRAEAAS